MQDKIENMLSNIATGNSEKATQDLTYILSQKAASAIESLKAGTVGAMFNPPVTQQED